MFKTALASKKKGSYDSRSARLRLSEMKAHLSGIQGWTLGKNKITKVFAFKNYYETSAFVNAVVWIAHRENHHPNIAFDYKQCEVSYSTHSVKGLTLSDFMSAAKVDALFQGKG